MIPAVLIATIIYIAYLVWEKAENDKALSSFKAVIHVNGIRGKTDTCRLIDAHLRGAGMKIFTKTTGSDAAYITVNGDEIPIKRLGPASIHEQIRMLRLAKKQGAEVVVLECMAVKPALQKIAQEQIVKGNINVITNVRYDHILEMGSTKQSIAESLSGTVPEHGVLLTSDEAWFPFFQDKCREKGSRCVLCKETDGASENEALAIGVGKELGISEDGFREHLSAYRADYGTRKVYKHGGLIFLNLFSVNDPESTEKVLQKLLKNGDAAGRQLVFLYNHRADRPDRLLLFEKYFFPNHAQDEIIVTGGNGSLAVKRLQRAGFHAQKAASWQEAIRLADGKTLIGIGNIKGEAAQMIDELEGEMKNE